MRIFTKINLKGDLVASLATFAGLAIVKFASSLILTRILLPDAYGIITILMSVSLTLALLSDVGTYTSIVRAPNGESPTYLNTAWTIRFARSVLNATIMFFATPVIVHLFGTPALAAPLRVFALWFLIDALESNSVPIAARKKNTRVVVYSDLIATVVSTAFTVIYCYFHRTFWGMVYGLLLNRALFVSFSYFFYRDFRPRFGFDRSAARDILQFTRFVMPSSVLTLVLSQFDKAVFLRFFDLRLLGIYGVASNIAGQVESLISRTSEMVVYPRCAHNFRADPNTFAEKYYTDNVRVFAVTGGMAAAVGGAAQLIISVLYDPRYALAGVVLQTVMIRAVLLSLASPAETMLIAAGQSHVILVSNIYRAISIVLGSIAGFYAFGFIGFLYGMALSGLPPAVYLLLRQKKIGSPVLRYELYRAAYMAVIAIAAFVTSRTIMTMFHVSKLKI
ncbi:MAG TPA: oligosaccharide flippase family protein [Steroidobacteraceae bacterium]|jgi:lipopolysaccharide exporter|nr:oligosaccharide flippase family protein [Steroidobacteraceae bacterium]